MLACSSRPPGHELLKHYLKELKLLIFLRKYRKIAEFCGKDRVDYQSFLLRLVEREIRAREPGIKAAKFPVALHSRYDLSRKIDIF